MALRPYDADNVLILYTSPGQAYNARRLFDYPLSRSMLARSAGYFDQIFQATPPQREHTIVGPPQSFNAYKRLVIWMLDNSREGQHVPLSLSQQRYTDIALLYQAARTWQMPYVEEQLSNRLQYLADQPISERELIDLLSNIGMADIAVELVVQGLVDRFQDARRHGDAGKMQRLIRLVQSQGPELVYLCQEEFWHRQGQHGVPPPPPYAIEAYEPADIGPLHLQQYQVHNHAGQQQRTICTRGPCFLSNRNDTFIRRQYRGDGSRYLERVRPTARQREENRRHSLQPRTRVINYGMCDLARDLPGEFARSCNIM